MGLLDNILGGAGGNGGGGGSPLTSILSSLLTNGAGGMGQAQPGQQPQGGMAGGMGGGGGMGGMLGSLLGSAAGSGMLSSVIGMFEQQGLGHIANSWVGNGENHPISPEQVGQVFGDDQVQQVSQQTGLPPQDVLSRLSQMLPGLVDRMTPNGQLPGRESL